MERQRRLQLNPLRLAVAACFLCHGTLALKAATVYYSEWSAWLQHLFPAPGYDGARWSLWTAGALDWLAALCVLLLLRIPRAAIAWTIGWGFATAMSRLYFLGSLTAPFWGFLVHPVAEMLQRVPNWIVPLLLWQEVRGRRPDGRLVGLAVGSIVLSLGLSVLVDLETGRYPSFMLRIDEPLWFYQACGALAAVALVLAAVSWPVKARRFRLAAMGAVALAYALPELFSVFWVNGPHGVVFTALRAGEHFPAYLCLLLAVRGASGNPVDLDHVGGLHLVDRDARRDDDGVASLHQPETLQELRQIL